MTEGITSAGNEAEEVFEKLVYAAIKTEKVSHGDKRVMMPDNSVYTVEIKKAGSVTGGSANQVRAIKYQVLVVFVPNRRYRWIVIPPNVVVEKAAEKSRGQHTEIAFECCTISLGEWAAPYYCDDDDLEEAVMEAIREGERHPALKRSMELLLMELKRMAHRTSQEVQEILATGYPPGYWGE